MICRFLGTETEINVGDTSHSLQSFGQRFELPDDFALAELRDPRGCPFLPDDQFREFFSDQEIAEYATPDSHLDAPKIFLAKKAQAIEALQSLRAFYAREQ